MDIKTDILKLKQEEIEAELELISNPKSFIQILAENPHHKGGLFQLAMMEAISQRDNIDDKKSN
jgi:hypothetical protein